MASFSRNELDFFINHLFMPPKLPQEDDFDNDLDEALIRLVTETLDGFGADLPSQQQVAVRHVSLAIKQLASSRDVDGAVEETKLLKALQELIDAALGSTIPLHIRAQNAGVMLSRGKEGIDLEAFELSASNQPVMSTKGRLRRCFPGPAITIPQELFDDTDLPSTIARALSMMSFQEGAGMTPTVRKSQNEVKENRDSTHPGLVTELLFSSLGPDIRPSQVKRVWKHTREEVLWQNCRLPWRRSPLWLHLRVVMHLLFGRLHDPDGSTSASRSTQGNRLYKLFLIHLLAAVLHKAVSVTHDMEPELLHCMSAKIVRRMLKLGVSPNEPGVPSAKAVLLQTEVRINRHWADVQARTDSSLDLARLASLQFDRDVTIALPDLDAFLAQMVSKESSVGDSSFSPTPDLKKFPAAALPTSSLWSNDEYEVHNLSAIEGWVAFHLKDWYPKQQTRLEACDKLKDLMKFYHGRASSIDPGNPERVSVMILTALELWVACDQLAIAQHPMLKSYNAGVPVENLKCLILSTKEQMIRLRTVEDYVKARADEARYRQPGSIFTDFGTNTCFSVRYFDQSHKHQELKRRIEAVATTQRQQKCEELAQKKAQHKKLMQDYYSLDHTLIEVYDRYGCLHTEHRDCQKCRVLSQAKSIRIEIHEWPLPAQELKAKSVVFELDTPGTFCAWRDATIFLIQNVLGSEYEQRSRPEASYSLREYAALRPYFATSICRVGLLSDTKPHVNTHRNNFSIPSTTTRDVCLNNGLQYQYFDNSGDGSFICRLVPTTRVLKSCTYQLPAESSALQKFLSRSFQGKDSTPNEVISSQSECPPHFSLAEFRALASIPVGYRLQWTNILVQLSCPTIDLKKPEATLVMFQAIFQTGPSDGDSFRRGSHSVLADDSFANNLLTAVTDTSRRIRENWESMNGLCALIAIATRQLSLSSSPETTSRALDTLSELREIAFGWVEVLKTKLEGAHEDSQRTQFMEKLVETALICCGTFDVDDDHIADAALSAENASVFIQCSILIHDYFARKSSSAQGPLVHLLHRRWQRLAYRAYPILASAVVQRSSATCLDDALKACWTSYQRGDPWQSAENGADHWVVSNTAARSGQSLRVHYNLLTGKLLVNGLPLTRLPSLYEQTASYQELFGDAVLQIVPSSVAGMRFSSQRLYRDHSLDFGHDGKHMLLRATKNSLTFELLPRSLFQNRLPQQFVNNFFHWYNITTGEVEFRDKSKPWSTHNCSWRLRNVPVPGKWTLAKKGMRLVDPASSTGQALAAVLQPLKQHLWLSIVLAADSQTVEIELPQLQLNFHLRRGTCSVVSRKQRGFEVDSSQSIGTLVGLKTKLVVRNVSTNDRKVIIPAGRVGFARDREHVTVLIAPESGSPHVYAIDGTLQRLSDNGSLQSKLFLCYLHAVTSFCLPDPLTFRTGTEQALSILKSAAVRSFPVLPSHAIELLSKIDSLTPRREFYPRHLKDMQTVEWKPTLPVLSQHPHFHLAVQQLFKENEIAELYHPEMYQRPPVIKDVDSDLLRRDSCRSSTFRIYGFGAEDFTTALDMTYSARDSGQSSERALRAKTVAKMLFEGSPCLPDQPSCTPNLAQHILKTIMAFDLVKGPVNRALSPASLMYDAKWLDDHPKYWAEMWCWLHEHAQSGVSVTGALRFRIMMWFSTMAFAQTVDLKMLHAAASMFLFPEMRYIRPLQTLPSGVDFCLQEGHTLDQDRVRTIISTNQHPLKKCPEHKMEFMAGENVQAYRERQQATHLLHRNATVEKLLQHVLSKFPAPVLDQPEEEEYKSLAKYINMGPALKEIRTKFQIWYQNHLFTRYLVTFEKGIKRQPLCSLNTQPLNFDRPIYAPGHAKSFVSPADFFSGPPPRTPPSPPHLPAQKLLLSSHLELSSSRLDSLVRIEECRAGNDFERKYASELRQSQTNWQMDSQSKQQQHVLNVGDEQLRSILDEHLIQSQNHFQLLFDMIITSIREGLGEQVVAESLQHSSRLSPIFLLHQLSRNGWEDGNGWEYLPKTWRPWVVAFGVALTEVQRAKRLIRSLNDHNELARELQNEGHSNWDPVEHPDSLLLEIEGNLLIRNVQEEIAGQMRNPPEGKNTVMQLNMGEGKSSVIVPILSLALANGSNLVRVVVGKPQSRQMFQMLISKLGGLLNRRIFHLPFSRDLQLTPATCKAIWEECRLCMETRGVILLQPEHILSFELMGLESLNTGNEAIGRFMLQMQHFFNTRSRDIVDESDENFSVKFELIYTMGTQDSIDFAPERWIVIQTVLGIITEHVSAVKQALPLSIEVSEQRPGAFPRLRLLKADATDMLLHRVADVICTRGFSGFPISRQPPDSRQAVREYITRHDLSPHEVEKVEKSPFWTDDTKGYILLLRGLFAQGILAFAFAQKRWRVNYGLDNVRRPPTKLAVPYRAKDSPAPRAEFSQPDVVITLTCISYYYGGLDDDDLFLAFEDLVGSDQATDEYNSWVNDLRFTALPTAFRQLMGINLKDLVQCRKEVFPSFRYAKRTIDYFLQHVVFPKHMKEFPQKLSASGWDLGAVKSHPTTGFSGTIDSKSLLPLDVKYLDLPSQKGTNALVLEYLLRSENEVVMLPAITEASHNALTESVSPPSSDAEALLDVLLARGDRHLRVILDVGAQILELTNSQVAEMWLRKARDHDETVQAAIYFDDHEEMVVLDAGGSAESFWTSPYSDQLDNCLVFLDEAHTRGTDLKLPDYYRAAVTLGAGLTKDRLVQACMRMRKLGKGQSVVFCVPQDIQTKIREHEARSETASPGDEVCDIDAQAVLSWAIGETIRDIKNSMPLWALQGRRFERQDGVWQAARGKAGIEMSASDAEKFLEEEAQTVEHRYHPKAASPVSTPTFLPVQSSERLRSIEQRCREIGALSSDQTTLHEEQERELAPEIEEERQIERPPPATPANHSVHPDVMQFVSSGVLNDSSPALMPAFHSLLWTTAAANLDPTSFPTNILVTKDFAKTVLTVGGPKDSTLDAFQRPVQWVLTSQPQDWKRMVIISPYEAQELLPALQKSSKATLHVYSPRPTQEFSPLDTLTLYTTPSSTMRAGFTVPLRLRTQLNLFAGQLYFSSESEYIELCKILRLSHREATEGTLIAADGFILSSTSSTVAAIIQASTFAKSPVRFLKTFLTKTRRDCQSIEKTHVGKILDGGLLQESDFDS